MKRIAHKDFFNLYHVNESMSAPELVGFATNLVDKGDQIHWLRYDSGIEEDTTDMFYAEHASVYC